MTYEKKRGGYLLSLILSLNFFSSFECEVLAQRPCDCVIVSTDELPDNRVRYQLMCYQNGKLQPVLNGNVDGEFAQETIDAAKQQYGKKDCIIGPNEEIIFPTEGTKK